MMSRFTRFQRVNSVSPIKLMGRDQKIIRLIHRHRFLRSQQTIALIDGSAQNLSRRLKWLFHHGYPPLLVDHANVYVFNGATPKVI